MPKLTRREFITATTAMGGALAIPTARGADAKTDAALNARTNLTGARRTLGYTLNVNGAAHRVALDPRVTLLDALREHIGDRRKAAITEVDEFVNPAGVKGWGGLGNVGTNAAIANAVYHATGKRIRELPIRLEKLL